MHPERIAADDQFEHGSGRAAELIAQHSSWRERLTILRRVPPTALPRLLGASFASLPRRVEPVQCEIATLDRYQEGLTELARYLSCPAPALPDACAHVERLLSSRGDCSGAIGASDVLFLHAFISVLAPDRVVEVGTLSGFSAAVVADAVAQHQLSQSSSVVVETIDLSQRCLTDQTQPVGFAIPQVVPGLSHRIRVHTGKDARHVEQIARAGELKAVFIDADHQHPRPTLDLIRVARFVEPRGWIIVHDINLGSAGERMAAAGTPFEHGAPFGAQWLFEAWPFEKISGGNIGALRLPPKLRHLVSFALAMLRIPAELEPLPARRTVEAFITALVEMTT